jgi:hypothetical protein
MIVMTTHASISLELLGMTSKVGWMDYTMKEICLLNQYNCKITCYGTMKQYTEYIHIVIFNGGCL